MFFVVRLTEDRATATLGRRSDEIYTTECVLHFTRKEGFALSISTLAAGIPTVFLLTFLGQSAPTPIKSQTKLHYFGGNYNE